MGSRRSQKCVNSDVVEQLLLKTLQIALHLAGIGFSEHAAFPRKTLEGQRIADVRDCLGWIL